MILDITLRYSNIRIIVFMATNSMITFLDFNDIDESFSHKTVLVLLPNNAHYYMCKKHYNYIARILTAKFSIDY